MVLTVTKPLLIHCEPNQAPICLVDWCRYRRDVNDR